MFSDGFESGDFSAWSAPNVGGDGQAIVQTGTVFAGSYAAQLSETSASGSYAYVRKYLMAPETVLRVSGDFMITEMGVSNANVPILRLFDANGNRIISLYRQNGNSNKIWIQHSGKYNSTFGKLSMNTWGHFELVVSITGPGTSTVQVYMDGSLIHESTTADLGPAGVASVQIGNETASQTFTIFVDEIVIER